jgi:hypothetical protein
VLHIIDLTVLCGFIINVVPTAFNYLMSPMYVVTLLYNLNLQRRDGTRRSGTGRSRSTDNRVTDISLGIRESLLNQVTSLRSMHSTFSIAEFHHTTVVTMDSAVGNAARTVDVRFHPITSIHAGS